MSKQLLEAGFSQNEIDEYNKFKQAGFSKDEIKEYYYQKKQPQSISQEKQEFGDVMRGVAGKVAPYAKEILPTAGLVLGGGGGTLAAGPVGGFAGAAGGYAVGQQLGDIIGQYGGVQQPKSLGGELIETGQDVLKGAGTELIGGAIGRAVAPLAKPLIKKIEPQVNKMIDWGIKKAIRPTVAGKTTYGQTRQYFKKAREAVKTIVTNKENLNVIDKFGNKTTKLPQTLDEFSQAIDNTKKSIFKQYDDIAKEAGQYGEVVDLGIISKEIEPIINSKPLNDFMPDIVKYAQQRVRVLKSAGKYTTKDAQDLISQMNTSLQSYYKNPTPATAGIAQVDALIANNVRKNLDNVIEKTVQPGYQVLKNKYGSLKTIEKEVNQRAIVDARKNQKGLIDFSHIFSGSEIVRGLMNMNPASIAAGATAGTVAKWIKHLNSPNRIVKSMFSGVEKAMNKYPKVKLFDVPTAIKAGGYTLGKKITDSPDQSINTIMGATATPANALSVEQMATKAYLNGNHKNALTLFQQAIRKNPKDAQKYKTAIDQILQEIKGLQSRNIKLGNGV